MTLTPTNVVIQGYRIWVQDAPAEIAECIDYNAQYRGLHVNYEPKLPKLERIENAVSKGPSHVQRQEGPVTATGKL